MTTQPIYINGRFATKPIMGVTRYAKEVVEALDRLALQQGLPRLQLICPTPPTMTMVLHHTDIVVTGGGSGYAWEQLVLPRHAPGPLISLCNTGPVFKRKHVVCIHGMNTAIASSAFSLSFRLGYGAVRNTLGRTARVVTTVSKFSRSQLDHFGVRKARRIDLAPCGCDHAERWDMATSRYTKADFPRPYIFALGTGAHKNFGLLTSIAGELEKHGIDVVIAGGKHDNLPGELVHDRTNVRALGFVSEGDLAFLFAHAAAFAFPSFTEGFGIPPLEAMHFDCPVVASNAGSVPEILGQNAAILLPPEDHATWARTLIDVVTAGPYTARVAAGRALTSVYRWEKTAQIYLDLLQKV
jgi:glycosyltransferase involved in cell wall biosynthesis